MQNRWRAVLFAIAFSTLPLTGFIAAIIVGLMTLRSGARDGLIVLSGVLFADAIWISLGSPPFIIFYEFICGSVFVWVFALLLRRYNSWSTVMQAVVLAGVGIIFIVHLSVDNISAWWAHYFQQLFAQLEKSVPADQQQSVQQLLQLAKQTGSIQRMANIATGMLVAAGFVGGIINLLLARIWQARLYNPGGFAPEFYQLRVGIIPAGLVVVCGLAAYYGGIKLAMDVLPVLLLLPLVVGFSLVHYFSEPLRYKMWLLVGFYVLLIFQYPYSVYIVIAVGLLDTVIDFRRRFKRSF